MEVLEKKEFPLGECSLTFTPKKTSTPVDIGITLEESDSVFTCTSEVFKLLVDQLSGPYKTKVLSGEAKYKCSILADLELLSALTNVYEKGKTGYAYSTRGKEMYEGKLVIHPIAAGVSKDYDITGPKVFVSVESNFNFNKNGYAKCDLTFEFADDEDPESPTFGKSFTIGTYTKNE